ncbi:hypothetical protein ACYJW8_06685 [Frateuria aurantia]
MQSSLSRRPMALGLAMTMGCTIGLWPVIVAASDAYTSSQYLQIQRWREQASTQAHRQALQSCHLEVHAQQLPAGDASRSAPRPEPVLSRELLWMLQRDQSAREVYYALNTPVSRQRFKQVDADNLPRLRRILAQGFPTPATVGPEASQAALTLLIHADAAPELQRSVYRQILQLQAERQLPWGFALTMRMDRPAVVGAIAVKLKPDPSASAGHPPPPATAPADDCYAKQYAAAYHQQLRHTAAAVNF